MRPRRCAVALALLVGVPGGAQRPAPAPPPAWAHVTYISGASIYVDAGTRAGLREGSRLQVVRGASAIAELVVAYVSSSRASCTVVSATAPVMVGDSARYAPVAADPSPAVVPAPDAAAPRPAARRAASPVRGRLGVRYLSMRQDAPGAPGVTLTQPAFDVRLDGHRIGGTPLGLVVDVRAYRQNYARARGPTLTTSTRVYQTAVQWAPARGGAVVSVGRQFAGALTAVGLFDGVALDVTRRRVSVGGFSGSQPDPATFGVSGAVREHGAWVQLHNAPDGRTSWALTAGGVGSYTAGTVDREFASLQGTVNTRRVSVYATQEFDVNRDWKAALEPSRTTPTSTYAMVRLSPTDAVSFLAGYDNRRNVRLYRDFQNPEIAFDDAFRQGAWGGVSLSALGHLRVNADARTSRGGPAGAADSYTGSVHVHRLTPLQLGVQLRATRYDGVIASGDLASLSLEAQPLGTLRASVHGGRRSDRRADAALTNAETTWLGVDADVGLGRATYLMVSAYRETGAVQRNRQVMVALSYRF